MAHVKTSQSTNIKEVISDLSHCENGDRLRCMIFNYIAILSNHSIYSNDIYVQCVCVFMIL